MKALKIILIVLLIVLILAILFVYFCTFHYGLSNSNADFGTFGDYFGGTIGAIMSLISVVLIYITYREQVEFSNTQFAQANKLAFHQNFFSLLNVQRDIIKSFEIRLTDPIETDKEVEYKGYAAIVKLDSDLKSSMSQFSYESDLENWDFEHIREKVNILYREVIEAYGDLTLGHYFRHLYHLLSFIDKNAVDDKKQYYDFVQSQMSNEELMLLFYDALSDYGYPKMYNLIKGGMLENVSYTEFDYFKILCEKCYPSIEFK